MGLSHMVHYEPHPTYMTKSEGEESSSENWWPPDEEPGCWGSRQVCAVSDNILWSSLKLESHIISLWSKSSLLTISRVPQFHFERASCSLGM